MAHRWIRPPSTAWNAELFQQWVMNRVLTVFQAYEPQILTQAQEGAPWTDRTGNARQGLYVVIYFPEPTTIAIALCHFMEYGVYLELSNGGRFAIILPTMESNYQDLIASVRSVLS